MAEGCCCKAFLCECACTSKQGNPLEIKAHNTATTCVSTCTRTRENTHAHACTHTHIHTHTHAHTRTHTHTHRHTQTHTHTHTHTYTPGTAASTASRLQCLNQKPGFSTHTHTHTHTQTHTHIPAVHSPLHDCRSHHGLNGLLQLLLGTGPHVGCQSSDHAAGGWYSCTSSKGRSLERKHKSASQHMCVWTKQLLHEHFKACFLAKRAHLLKAGKGSLG